MRIQPLSYGFGYPLDAHARDVPSPTLGRALGRKKFPLMAWGRALERNPSSPVGRAAATPQTIGVGKHSLVCECTMMSECIPLCAIARGCPNASET